jgi:hypothetical protein
MNEQAYHELLSGFFEHLGLAAISSEEGVYTLEVNGQFQVLIGCHQEEWLQLCCELGPHAPQSDNLFGAQWPAHIQGNLDGQSILWSQQPLQGIDRSSLEAWLERFIDDVEQRLKPKTKSISFNPAPNLLRI